MVGLNRYFLAGVFDFYLGRQEIFINIHHRDHDEGGSVHLHRGDVPLPFLVLLIKKGNAGNSKNPKSSHIHTRHFPCSGDNRYKWHGTVQIFLMLIERVFQRRFPFPVEGHEGEIPSRYSLQHRVNVYNPQINGLPAD